MASGIDSADGWFRDKASEVSAHFGVLRDGRVFQWVRVGNAAWTNGIVARPDLSIDWLADAIRRDINVNNLTIGIEHEGQSGQPFTEAQYLAIFHLHLNLVVKYGIKPIRRFIIGHFQVDGVNRAHCPGDAFPWKRLMADLAAATATGNQPAPVEADPNAHYFPETGKWLVNAEDYKFLDYWNEHGGLADFGFPISGAYLEEQSGLVIQWFERACFEYHPEAADEAYRVQLRLLGRQAMPPDAG